MQAARTQAPPPDLGPAPGPVHWLAAREASPPDHVLSQAQAATLSTCYFFFPLFFSVNDLSFNLYKACSAAGRDLGLAGEREQSFLLDSVSSNIKRTPCRHFTLFKKLNGLGITPLQASSKDSSEGANEILPELFKDKVFTLLKNCNGLI